MASELQRLPPGFHTGVTEDGRIFFINELDRTTSWLHPATQEPVLTGLHSRPDLPRGWEVDTTVDGRIFFVDHIRGLTTFSHPFQGSTDPLEVSPPQSPQESSPQHNKENFKRGTVKQRSVKAPSAKRNPNSEVIKSGWLYRLESSGLSKSWKRRWVVLAEFALFIYKDHEESSVLSSILLPSYRINPCTEEDNIKRNFVFKVEHENTKTVYLATDDSPELVSWMSMLRQSAMMNGNAGFQREPNNNYRQHPFKDTNRGQMREEDFGDPSSHHPRDILDSSTHNLNRSSKNPNNIRPYNPQDSDPHHLPQNRYSSASQSPSYKGYHDPAYSPQASPKQPRPRIGGVYPFIFQQGQRRSYVSQTNSNRNSLANSPQAPANSSSSYPTSGGPDKAAFNPLYGHPPDPQRDQYNDMQNRYADNHYPPHSEQFPGRQKDGLEPDSVRSSLAQSDMNRSYQNPTNSYPGERDHMPQGLRNGHSFHGNMPAERDWARDQQQDSYSDIHDGREPKQLQQWDRNLPAMGGDNMKHNSVANLLDRVDRPQGDTFNVRSKSHENFSQFPNARHPNNVQSAAHFMSTSQMNDYRGSNSGISAPTWNRFPPNNLGSERNSYVDDNRRHDPNSEQNQRFDDYQKPYSHDFKQPNEESPQLRRGDAYGPMEPRYQYGYDRNSQSSFIQQSRNEPVLREVERHQDQRSFAPNTSYTQQPHWSPQDTHNHSSTSHTPQNSFTSYERDSNQGHFPPDQRWRDQNSFSSHSSRTPQHHPGGDMRQPPPNSIQSVRPNMHLDLSSQSDSAYPNPHTYVNLPSRKPNEMQPTQSKQDHYPRHNLSHDASQNLSHDSSSDPPPARPPYPASVRDQIVKEMAQTQTPVTQKDFLTSTEMNSQRMQQPPYFQYPSPRDQHSQDSPQDLDMSRQSRISQRSMDATFQAENENPYSRLSTASRASQSSRRDHRDGQPLQQLDTSARRNMMDPDAKEMRVAFERVQSLRMSPDRAQKKSTGSFIQRKVIMQNEQSPVKPPRVLSQIHRDYKSQDELDAVGQMPPPKGSYYKIRDDSEDLYQRGSAFRPPSSLSGSQFGTDSLQRMKKFSNTMPLNISVDNNENQDGHYHNGEKSYLSTKASQNAIPNTDSLKSWNYPNQGGPRQCSAEESFEDGHPFFDPYGTSSKVQQESHLLKLAAPPKRKVLPIQTVKEDPDMPDRDVLETDLQKVVKKNPLNRPRLRMSICADDLIGKTHDELVLLLIQLRRNQAALDKTRDFYKQQIDQRRNGELEFRRQLHQFGNVQDGRLHDAHHSYVEARGQMEEIEKKLEVYRPIINLLDNMVTMGSLYGGDNFMLATQYRKHLLRPDQYQAPRKMLEFSRQHQEDRLIQETNEEIKQLSAAEVDLEEKIDRLNEIDHLLQEQSFKVSSFKEDKELMERALHGIFRQQDQAVNDPYEMRRLTQQQRTLEKEISRVTQQLAEASKELEETTAENNKLEHEVALLRTKVHGELTRSRSAPSLASESVRTKMKMEKELAKVQDIMQGLNQQGAKLSQAMNTLRRSSSGTQLAAPLDDEETSASGTYLQTDLDTGDQVDLGKTAEQSPHAQHFISHQRQNASGPDDWNADDGDENTRKFFGLGPRDKIKGPTVRDVKRLSEARRERDKRKDEEDHLEEIKLRVSNVDTEDSSFIQARIASDLKSRPTAQPWEAGHPLYENLPRYGSVPSLPDSQSASSSRRSSIILMAPKPFTPYQEKSARPFKSEFGLDVASRENGITQRNAEQANGHFPGQGDLQSNGQEFYPSTFNPVSSQPVSMYNGDYMSQQNQSQVAAPYSEGQFHAKPLTIQPVSQSNRTEPLFTQDSTDGLQQEQRADMRTFGDHLTQTVGDEGSRSSPWAKGGQDFRDHSSNAKKKVRGCYQTISSSQPFTLESNSLLSPTLHSSAGDLILNRSIDDVPDIVKSSQTKVDQIDGDVIDREILYVPDKVLIPERYDAEADAEQLTEEDKMRRREKAERIKRVLTSQSVLSMSQPDISHIPATDFHSRVEHEKKERAHFLALNQELARQVTLQSKKQAAERRKTWSGAQFADAKKQYEEELLNASSSPLRSPDMTRKRAEITMRDI